MLLCAQVRREGWLYRASTILDGVVNARYAAVYPHALVTFRQAAMAATNFTSSTGCSMATVTCQCGARSHVVAWHAAGSQISSRPWMPHCLLCGPETSATPTENSACNSAMPIALTTA